MKKKKLSIIGFLFVTLIMWPVFNLGIVWGTGAVEAICESLKVDTGFIIILALLLLFLINYPFYCLLREKGISLFAFKKGREKQTCFLLIAIAFFLIGMGLLIVVSLNQFIIPKAIFLSLRTIPLFLLSLIPLIVIKEGSLLDYFPEANI